VARHGRGRRSAVGAVAQSLDGILGGSQLAMTPRRCVAMGAGLCVLGLALSGTAPVGTAGGLTAQTTGGVLVVAGWALLAWGIHRLGRKG
jgi:hypothetical protein